MNKLASEQVVISAPMSFSGSATRIWKLTNADNAALKLLLLVPLALLLITVVWVIVLCWYLVFGILVIPYRLIRRGSRKNKRDQLRHREMLEAIQKNKQ